MKVTHFISCTLKYKHNEMSQMLNDCEFMTLLGHFSNEINELYEAFERLDGADQFEFLETMSRLLPLSTKIFTVLIETIEDGESLKTLLKNTHKNYLFTLKESIGYSKYNESFEDMRVELLEINKSIDTLNGKQLELSKTLVKQSKRIEDLKNEIAMAEMTKESNRIIEEGLLRTCDEIALLKNSNEILQKEKNKKTHTKERLAKVKECRKAALNKIELTCSELLQEARLLGLEEKASRALLENLRTSNNRAEFLRNEIAIYNDAAAKTIERKLETIILDIDALSSNKVSLEEMILNNRRNL